MHRSLALFSIVALLGCASSGPPKTVRSGEGDFDDVERTSCIGGLCVKPDHVMARRDGPKGRCLVMAWDGSSLPPTAKMGAYDDSLSRPGILTAVDVPAIRDGASYRVVLDPEKSGTGLASVFAVRVDPSARFADHRIAESGDVTIVREGDDARITVKTKWGERTETASFVLARAHNGCNKSGF